MNTPVPHARLVLIHAIACLLARGQGLWTRQGRKAVSIDGSYFREPNEIIIDRVP